MLPTPIRGTCAWLLALVMPFHALVALYLDWRGPAHSHKAMVEHASAHSQDRMQRDHYRVGDLYSGGERPRARHEHPHADVGHHHHHPGDTSVIASGKPIAPEAFSQGGRSGTMVAALTSAEARWGAPHTTESPPPHRQQPVQQLFSNCLERPPRFVRA